jgi:hypothetical protein
MTIGSCFAENVGHYFDRYKFNITINPFGQQYNPYSITHAIHRLLSLTPYTEADLVLYGELYHSFDHHGSFSRSSAEDTLTYINSNLQAAAESLLNTSVLFLTFGTSHFFRLKETGRVVSNCHKLPGTHFDFELMRSEQIIEEMTKALSAIWQIKPSMKIVFTVSPVRYFAFGHFENSVSKAHLFTAIHTLCGKHPQLYYFPAYELVIDDLRDYRFYADDMLHPSSQAIDYVWESMAQTLLPPFTQEILGEIDEIVSAAGHRPRNPNTHAHRKFIETALQKIQKLEEHYKLDFAVEKEKLILST